MSKSFAVVVRRIERLWAWREAAEDDGRRLILKRYHGGASSLRGRLPLSFCYLSSSLSISSLSANDAFDRESSGYKRKGGSSETRSCIFVLQRFYATSEFFLCLGDYVSRVWYVVRNQATDEKAALDFPWARISLEKDESTRLPRRRRGAESMATKKSL